MASQGPTTQIPLTTIFTPPASCSSSWTYEPSEANLVLGGLLVQNAATSDNADPSCFPSGFNQYGRKTAATVFSPGYCPMGYTSADVDIERSLTTAVCCLSDYQYSTGIYENGDAIYAGCIKLFSGSTIVTVRQKSADSSTQVTGPITMWAQPITIQLHSSDSSLFVTGTTTIVSTATFPSAQPSSTAPSVSETGSGAPTSSPQPESSGLSRGAGIGVGVGIGVGGIAIFAAIGLWLWRRRKAKKYDAVAVNNYQPQEGQYKSPPALYGASRWSGNRNAPPSELDASKNDQPVPIHELGG
ncbi:hypothetical protein EMPG_16339 [Blastomyces silverae]|uniref:Mid2 domain-containing protein n=1 Tax=Blastomyces silverae TaxID=2060906 RepID=A0A0H1BB09_9EURO|nr:hypothetical protein EMPG_16339 [Blastomyces silverae]